MTDPAEALRDRLERARLMLVLTPEACRRHPPERALEAALPFVDIVQVRVKAPGERSGPSPARSLLRWTHAVLDRCAALADPPLVLVNDRVDVALALLDRGVHGVHLGDRDLPPAEARALLGPAPLLGLSTHSGRDVARAADDPVDYLGFGPVRPTATKGYDRGLGPDLAWAAARGAGRPVFPIGGIDAATAVELAPVGRAAVGAAVLEADDPARAARELRALLESDDDGL